MKKFNELAEEVTNEMLEELKKGNVVWRKEWRSFGAAKNYVTGRSYEGFNQLYLMFKSSKRNYKYPYFLTFKQAKELGGYVRGGEKATPIIFWKINNIKTGRKVTDGRGGEKEELKTTFYPFLHFVFNISQVDGIDFVIQEDNLPKRNPIEVCENMVGQMPQKPEIRYNSGDAYYVPSLDYVNMPSIDLFRSEPAFYSTQFHELIHATGHKSRLNRFKEGQRPARFGDEEYSKEELIAEMGAAMLCSYAGITNEDTKSNSVAYIQGWMKALQNDKTLLITAANRAQKAASFILNLEVQEEECMIDKVAAA